MLQSYVLESVFNYISDFFTNNTLKSHYNQTNLNLNVIISELESVRQLGSYSSKRSSKDETVRVTEKQTPTR